MFEAKPNSKLSLCSLRKLNLTNVFRTVKLKAYHLERLFNLKASVGMEHILDLQGKETEKKNQEL